jgi:hypothetical protein
MNDAESSRCQRNTGYHNDNTDARHETITKQFENYTIFRIEQQYYSPTIAVKLYAFSCRTKQKPKVKFKPPCFA